MTDFSQWEDSKENIQPLKKGRDPTKLSQVFGCQESNLKEKQEKLEKERQYVVHYQNQKKLTII